MYFTNDEYIMHILGRDWLNNQFMELKENVFNLGYEIFGDDFPEFKNYNSLLLSVKTEGKQRIF